MHPIEQFVAWLILSDIFWGALVVVYLAIGYPIMHYIIKKREDK